MMQHIIHYIFNPQEGPFPSFFKNIYLILIYLMSYLLYLIFTKINIYILRNNISLNFNLQVEDQTHN